MPKYLLIESRDPFDSNDTHFCGDLAQQLAAAKNDVTLFLVQNGVLPVRPGARSMETRTATTSRRSRPRTPISRTTPGGRST